MLARRSRAIIRVVLPLAVAVLAAACEKVPLLAPTGSTITLISGATALPANGSTTIVAQVLESAGTPPHSGTSITFTTSLGTVQPSTASTDVNGRVTVTFLAGLNNGTANINAISGGATTASAGTVKIAIGTASVGGVRVGANPTNVSSFGGTSVVTATVFDINGNVLPAVPVAFTTSAGSLGSSLVTTDNSGNASTTLTTTVTATVTATVGATGGSSGTTPTTPTTGTPTTGTPTTGTTTPTTGQQSGTVTVTVTPSPALIITPPTTPPSAGLSAAFTFAVTVPSGGATVKNVTVNWGDGQTQTLGTITGSQVVGHVYNSAGSYNISAVLTDTLGNTLTTGTSTTVIPVANPTVIITPSIPSSCATSSNPCDTTFQLQITAPTGVIVQQVSVNWGDASDPTTLGGVTGTVTVPHTYAAHAGPKIVTVTVTDSAHTASTTAQTSVNIP